ncbi:MAG: alpha/beta hydrolase [Anaerolineae bacterium]|nr:alpha/beta hydrolase [Anaerolineae bacterium]
MTHFFTSSHGKIAYTDTQTGAPPLIFMHGLPTSKELWLPVIPFLNPKYRVIAFDLNDYGESEKIGKPISHKERADVLDQLRAHLGLDTFTLIGHDLGSSIAVEYMGKYPRHVERLALMSPPVYPDFPPPPIIQLVRLPGVGEFLSALPKICCSPLEFNREWCIKNA